MTGIPPIAPYPLPAADDLPAGPARWTVDPDRAVLLLHDMQRYFLRPFDRSRDPLHGLLRNCVALREACVARGVPVAYTAQPGGMDREQRGLLHDVWGPGMEAAPEHREIVPELAPGPGDRVFTKWRYSAFHRSSLLEYLLSHGRDQLVIGGVYGHVGVLMTAVDSFSHDIETFLAADAIADFDRGSHDFALRYAARRCAVVVATSDVLRRLGSTGEPPRLSAPPETVR
ncbi:isochorismatase family protein [Streptomyces sp. NPDC006645]|uniref:isochorismatase family protein n=1 Tax=unclassified Streptomyces TaxID=2593676 RepID=UPI0033A213D6